MAQEPERVMSYTKIQEMVDLERLWERKLSRAQKKAQSILDNSSKQAHEQAGLVLDEAKKQARLLEENSQSQIQSTHDQTIEHANKRATRFKCSQSQVDSIAKAVLSDIERFIL